MRISELVEKLERAKAKYGDLVVMDMDADWGETDLPENGVYVDQVHYVFNKETREVRRENRLVIDLHGNAVNAKPAGELL